jgi:hypothetical protein
MNDLLGTVMDFLRRSARISRVDKLEKLREQRITIHCRYYRKEAFVLIRPTNGGYKFTKNNEFSTHGRKEKKEDQD